MGILWLTYAWKNNDDGQVDFVISKLKGTGIEVHYDRAQIGAGRRLWDQLDTHITDPKSTDAWAIYATKEALESEPCNEELAYALDRALRTKGKFPLIGIFPEPIAREHIPSAIITRLYVDLRDSQWAERVAAEAGGNPFVHNLASVPELLLKRHTEVASGRTILEIRPRAGTWYPTFIMVPADEISKLSLVVTGPPGSPPFGAMTTTAMVEGWIGHKERPGKGIRLGNRVDAATSAFIYFDGEPSLLSVGTEGNMFQIYLPNVEIA